MWGRIAAVAITASVALAVAPDGLKIIACAAAGAGVWAIYHALRERRGGIVGNQPFEWPRLFVWVVVCVAMIPLGGLIGLALVVVMILALAEFMPTLESARSRSRIDLHAALERVAAQKQARIMVNSAHA